MNALMRSLAIFTSHSNDADSGRIQLLGVRIGKGLEVRVGHSFHHDEVNRASESILQILCQAEVGIEGIGDVGFEFDQEVDIAAGMVETIRDCGAENCQPSHTPGSADPGDGVGVNGRDVVHPASLPSLPMPRPVVRAPESRQRPSTCVSRRGPSLTPDVSRRDAYTGPTCQPPGRTLAT